MSFFAFHGSLNKVVETGEPGDFIQQTDEKNNDEWHYENTRIQLKSGDILYFWIYVQHDIFGYHLNNQRYVYPGEVENKILKKY